MKRYLCVFLVLLMTAALFAGCTSDSEPTNGSSAATGAFPTISTNPQNTDAPATSTETNPPVEAGFDMAAFLNDLSAAHPGADPKTLCDAILEDPYFTLFSFQDTEFYYPGVNWDYTPEGIRESAAVVDYMSGSGALVYVLEPEEGKDPEVLRQAFSEHLEPNWMFFDEPLDCQYSVVLDGKVFAAMYRSDMEPVKGPIAANGQDFVEMFHNYVTEHPEADCLELAQYFASHQKIGGMDAYTVTEGTLAGFGDFEAETKIEGFQDGAVFTPLMTPNTFIGYVFRPRDGVDRDAFIAMLRENANLNWNVCVSADLIITETEGDLVLFMMCSES